MALPDGTFWIQSKLQTPAPHHESWQKLWETKWSRPCSMGVYPFMIGGCPQDFEPIYRDLSAKGLQEPYDWSTYPEHFVPTAEALEQKAIDAEKEGDKDRACEYYVRASTVYRFGRFPAVRSERMAYCWQKSKETVLKHLALKGELGGFTPVREVLVPHTHRLEHEGADIPVFFQVPDCASPDAPAPCLVIFTGLDGFRTELVVWAEGWRRLGVAVVIVEIPGTGDSPADPKDPLSPDREWSSLFDWLDGQERIDKKKICVQGFSTGGFYAVRVAHTHADRLLGSISFGGGAHHCFDKEWLDCVNHLEYPFDLANVLAQKWGYGEDVESFKTEASSRFSLLNDGTLLKPRCARLLLVNGTEDEIFPIDDMFVCLQHGAPKEARMIKGFKHMGEPESFGVILNWIYRLFDLKDGDVGKQMSTVPFKPKYP